MKRMFLTAAIVCFTFAGFAQSTGKINVKAGSKYMITSNVKSVSNVEAMGQQVSVNADAENQYELDVNKVDNEGTTVTGAVKAIKVHTSVMGQESNYDSKDPNASGPVADKLKGVIDQPQTVVLNDQGKVVKTVNDLEGELKELMQQVGGSNKGPESAFLVVPAGVKAGQTFDKSDEDTASGTKSKITYTVKSINGDMANLTFTGTLSTNTKQEQMGMEIETDLKGTTQGESVVNLKSGLVKSTKSTTKMEGTSTAMGQDMPTSAEITTDSTVEEIK